jgi:hypothetical protein
LWYRTAFMPRILVLACLTATLLSLLAAETKWAAGGGTSARVGVFLDFDQLPSSSIVQAMQREVSAVLAETGARFSWIILRTETAAETFDELAVLRFRGNCRAGRFTGAPNSNRITLGSTEIASAGVTSYSNVECDQLQSCLSGMLGTFCPSDRDGVYGRALGRVVAHELYHILGRTTHHTHHGVARAMQSPFDLVKQDYQIDREALLWVRQRLQPAKKDRARDGDPERGITAASLGFF